MQSYSTPEVEGSGRISRYDDPSGHCIWDACIIEGIGVIELAALTVTAYTAIQAALHPDQRQATVNAVKNVVSSAASTVSNAVKNVTTFLNGNKQNEPPTSTKQTGNSPSGGNPGGGPPKIDPTKTIATSIPPVAYDTWNKIQENGLKPLQGYVSGVYKNVSPPFLPDAPLGTYMKHDVYPFVSKAQRGFERLVIDIQSGNAWYTPDRYETWVPFD